MKVKLLSISSALVVFVGLNLPMPASNAITLGCSKAQSNAKQAGYTATVAIQAEERYVNRSDFTEAYQEYLAINRFTNEWRDIVSKSPKCFKSQRIEIEPIFKNYYKKTTMCERYGNSICKLYPSERPPRKPFTLADICGKDSSSYSYKTCIERLSERDRYDSGP